MRSQTSMIERHVVVDQEHAGAVIVAHGADDGGELGTSASGRPAAGSSMSTKRGSHRERARDAEAALVAVRERAGRRSCWRREAEQRRAARRPAGAPRAAPAPTPSAATSTFSRTVRSRNELRMLERAREPGPARRCGLQPRDLAAAELDRARTSGGRSPSSGSRAWTCRRRSGRSARRPRVGAARASRPPAPARPRTSARRRALAAFPAAPGCRGCRQGARSRHGPRWPRTTPGPPQIGHVAQTFGTTFAMTEPMTFSLVPLISITRYFRPKTLCYAAEKLTRPERVGTFLNFDHLRRERRAVRRVAGAGVRRRRGRRSRPRR